MLPITNAYDLAGPAIDAVIERAVAHSMAPESRSNIGCASYDLGDAGILRLTIHTTRAPAPLALESLQWRHNGTEINPNAARKLIAARIAAVPTLFAVAREARRAATR